MAQVMVLILRKIQVLKVLFMVAAVVATTLMRLAAHLCGRVVGVVVALAPVVLVRAARHRLGAMAVQAAQPQAVLPERSPAVVVAAQTPEQRLVLAAMAKSSSLSSQHKDLTYDNLCCY
jgi:hypothetical protein